jgi:hypothetical protein
MATFQGQPKSVLRPVTGQVPVAADSSLLPPLDEFLRVTAERYDACIAHVDHDYVVAETSATLRLHYVRTDANGVPKFKELARILAWHIGYYAVMAQRHRDIKDQIDHAKILSQARNLLRRYAKSGEPGELLLYFLIEAVLKAPQAICKVSLKTNQKEEVKGSDGVHIKWDAARKRLIVYFGEAKLYQNLSAALAAAFQSMETFHDDGAEEHETFLVSTHFNLLDDKLKQQVCRFLDKTASPATYETHHACVVGFNWAEYGNLDDPANRRAFLQEFERRYREYGAVIHAGVEGRMRKFPYKHLTFEFFFVPFQDVQDFRFHFLKEVFGEVSK